MPKEVVVNIPGGVGSIEAKYLLPEKNYQTNPIVIVCHPHPLYGGSMENKVVTTLFKTFKELAFPVLRFNFRGVGKTQGCYNGGVGETDDLLSVINWVQRYMPDNPIWLAGFSFGAYVTLRAQQRVCVDKIILVAPPVSLFHCHDVQPRNIPCTIIHGSKDDLIPYNKVCNWAGKSTNNIVLHCLEGACHFFHGFLTELSTVLRTRIKEVWSAP